MSKKALLFPLIISITSCGLFQSPPPVTPVRMAQNVSQIPSGTIMEAIATVPMDIPNPSQPKIVNSAAFRVAQNILSNPGSAILIPQNAFIIGVYSNDGTTRQISWQAVYSNYRAMEQNEGSLSIAPSTNNTPCDAKTGIKDGQLVNITFK